MTRQEEIARIVDPASWRNFDYWSKPGPRRMTPAALESMVKPSLDKARMIMALPQVTSDGLKARDRITEGLVTTPSVDCPNGGRCFTHERCVERGHCGSKPVTA